ncbi:MAG: hypothetical protein J4G04_03930 [Nitrosopumilaceae archaeon]|nr:hypothetical protein [Nitrosopumilaceae archaeon]
MKGALLAAVAVTLAAAAYPAYADDYAASLQDVIDIWTDLRNDYLAESFFGESYTTPEMAAVETVNGAIGLYESTRANPQVQVTQRGTFVQHPINPYGTTVVAFDVINSMHTSEEVYPFVIDAGTLKVLAEGAFPGTVGLSAVFLDDADRPAEEILKDLQESEGTWVSYIFNNPSTSRYDVKHTYLSLYDGYIFGSGYYESPDQRALEGLETMVRMYDADGTGSFAAIPADYGVSFVLEAGTLEAMAHTNPDISGSAISDALATTWSLESLSDILARHGSLWVSYPSAEQQPGSEYVRANLRLHDGHVFGSGYGITPETRIQSLTHEAIQLYEMEGEDSYPIITSMKGTLQLVLEPGDNIVLAFAGRPNLVGQTIGTGILDQDPQALGLSDTPGQWTDNVFIDPLATSAAELRRSSWLVLHDGHIFAAGRVYSPEAASIEAVDAAIALYKTHGEEAFDRITWQSVRPEIIYPFAHVAQTWELVAHAAVPERVGVCCAAPIAASNDLDAARQALEQNPGIWLEYTFYNPISDRYEYKRAWFSTYDGYTFAAGYYYGNFDQMERTIQEAIDLYVTQGKDAAFASINAMRATGVNYPLILDRETLEIVAHGHNPNLVGTSILDRVAGASDLASKIEADLRSDGDTTVGNYAVLNLATRSYTTQTALLQLHDGYIFWIGQPFVVYTR